MGAPEQSDVLREASPRVTRRLLLGQDVLAPRIEGLDLTNDDQAIINQALALIAAGDDVLLLTDDNFVAMTAEELNARRGDMDGEGEFRRPRRADVAKIVGGLIIGRASAGNLASAVEARLPLRIDYEDEDVVEMTEQLVDDLERRARS